MKVIGINGSSRKDGNTAIIIGKVYQLIRNIIRADSESKTVIFITDANNPSTNNDISCFCNKFLTKSITKPLFWTWQEICARWPADIEKPFQFVCFEDTASV